MYIAILMLSFKYHESDSLLNTLIISGRPKHFIYCYRHIKTKKKNQRFLIIKPTRCTFGFFFDVHVTVHRDKFLIIKPTRCTNFSNVFLE